MSSAKIVPGPAIPILAGNPNTADLALIHDTCRNFFSEDDFLTKYRHRFGLSKSLALNCTKPTSDQHLMKEEIVPNPLNPRVRCELQMIVESLLSTAATMGRLEFPYFIPLYDRHHVIDSLS